MFFYVREYIFLKAMRSCSFPTPLDKGAGRKFDGSELSPFFGKGIMFDRFHNSENLPSLKDLLNKMLNGTEMSLATGFNILLLIPSGPQALFGFKISISDCISDAVQDILNSWLWRFNSKAGK